MLVLLWSLAITVSVIMPMLIGIYLYIEKMNKRWILTKVRQRLIKRKIIGEEVIREYPFFVVSDYIEDKLKELNVKWFSPEIVKLNDYALTKLGMNSFHLSDLSSKEEAIKLRDDYMRRIDELIKENTKSELSLNFK
jgi:hypothetical protein